LPLSKIAQKKELDKSVGFGKLFSYPKNRRFKLPFDLATLERHTIIAFNLMSELRHNQASPAYQHAAKAWIAMEAELRKARRLAKKEDGSEKQP